MVYKLTEEVQAIQKQITRTDQDVAGREMNQQPDGYGQEMGPGYGMDKDSLVATTSADRTSSETI